MKFVKIVARLVLITFIYSALYSENLQAQDLNKKSGERIKESNEDILQIVRLINSQKIDSLRKSTKNIFLDEGKSQSKNNLREDKIETNSDDQLNQLKNKNTTLTKEDKQLWKILQENLDNSYPVQKQKESITQKSFALYTRGNGRLTFNPSTLAYGNIYLNKKLQQQLVVTNSSSSDSIEVSSIFFNTVLFGYSLADSGYSFKLAPLGTRTININFLPTISGVDTGYLFFNHDGLNSKDSIRITGTGVTPTFSPVAWRLDFVTRTINTSKIDSIKINNTSLTTSLVISSITSNGSVFTVTPTSNDTITALNSKYIKVTFTPTAITLYNNYLIFTHNGATSPDSIILAGSGEMAILSLRTNSATLKNAVVNNPASESIVLLSNQAVMTPLYISSITSTNTVFAGITTDTAILAGQELILYAKYSPTVARRDTGKIIITHSGASIRDTVTLFAEAIVNEFSTNKTKVDFGDVGNNATKKDSVTITNTMSSDTLKISSVKIYVDGFTVTPTSANIAGNGTQKFYITYSPLQKKDSTQVVFYHNGIIGIDTVFVVGRKADGNFSITKRSINFGQISLLKQKNDSVVISNTGSLAPLVISSAFATNIQFLISPSYATIPINGSKTFYITFAPTYRGVVNSNLIFSHNGNSLIDTVSLVGEVPYPIAVLSRKSISFGVVHTNQTVTDTLYVSNNSKYDPLIISSVESDNSVFDISPLSTKIDTMGKNIFVIRFLPTERKTYSGKIVFKHNGNINTDTLNLSGKSTDGIFSASTTNFQFASVAVGYIKYDTILISNTSNEIPLKISSVKSTSPYFYSHIQEAILAPLQAIKFPVTFTAKVIGLNSAQLYFSHDGTTLLDTVNITGTTISPILTVQSPINLGTMIVNSSVMKKVTLRNNTISQLIIHSIYSSSSDVTFTELLPIFVNANDTAGLTLTLKPNSAGALSISLFLNHNGVKETDTIIVSAVSDVPLLAVPYSTGFDNNTLKQIPSGWISRDLSNSGQTFLVHSDLFYLPGNTTKYIGINSDSLRGMKKQIITNLISPVVDISSAKYSVLLSYAEYFATIGTAVGTVKAVFDNDTILVEKLSAQTTGWVEKKFTFTSNLSGKKNFRLVFDYDDKGNTNLGWGIDNISVHVDPKDSIAPTLSLIPIDNYTMNKSGNIIKVNATDNYSLDTLYLYWRTREGNMSPYIDQTRILMTFESGSTWKGSITIPGDPYFTEVEYYVEASDKNGNKSKSLKNNLQYFKEGQNIPWYETFDGLSPNVFNYEGFEILKNIGVNQTKAGAYDAFGADTAARASTYFINLKNQTTNEFLLRFAFQSIKYRNFESYKLLGDSVIIKISLNQEVPQRIFRIDSSTNLSQNGFTNFSLQLKNHIPAGIQHNSMRIFIECYADKQALKSGANYLMVIDNLAINTFTADITPPIITGNFGYFATTKSDSIRVEVKAVDNVGIRNGSLHYYSDNTFFSKDMTPIGDNKYVTYIHGYPQGTTVNYAVFMTDSSWNVSQTPLVTYDVVSHKTAPYSSINRSLPLYLYSGNGNGTNVSGGIYYGEDVGYFDWGTIDRFNPNFDIATPFFLPINNRSIFGFKYILQALDSTGTLKGYPLKSGDSLFVYLVRNEKEKILLETITSSNHLPSLTFRSKAYDVSNFKSDSLQFHIAAKTNSITNNFTLKFENLHFKTLDVSAPPVVKLVDSTFILNVIAGTSKSGNIRITNEGFGYLKYSAMFVPNLSWLSVSPSTDSLLTGKIQLLKISVNSTSVEKGIYNTILNLATNDPLRANVKIPISIVVLDRASIVVHINSNGAYSKPAVTTDGVVWGSNGHSDKAKAVYVPVGNLEYDIANVKIAFAKSHNTFAYNLEIYTGTEATGPINLLYQGKYSLDRILSQKKLQDSAKSQYFIDSVQFTDHYLHYPVSVNIGCFVVIRFTEVATTPGAIAILHNEATAVGSRTWDLTNNNKWEKMNTVTTWGKEYLPLMIVTAFPTGISATMPELSSANMHDSLNLRINANNVSGKIVKQLSLTIEYPDSIVRFIRADKNNSSLKDMSLSIETLTKNRIRLTATSSQNITLTDGLLINLVFATNEGGTKPVSILNFSINNNSEYGSSVNGSIKVIGSTFADNDKNVIPKEFALYQNFPNPFNPSTEIKFDLPKQSEVLIAVYDMLGREVARLVSGEIKAGSHTIKWNATNQTTGIYLVLFRADNFKQTRKMILIK